MVRKITDEMKREAVRLALEGGDYCKYLRENGSANPSAHWAMIKKNLLKEDPETYEKLAKLPDKRKKPEIPEAPTVKLDGAIRIETPEAHNVDIVETPEQAVIKNKVVDIMEELKIRNPLQYEEFTVREVEGLFGRYRRSDIGQVTYIDFEPPECVDVISNTLTQWSSFMKELKRAAQVLGVEL